jgi:hypothetical protein
VDKDIFCSLAMQVTHRINAIEQVLLAGLNRTGTTNKLFVE